MTLVVMHQVEVRIRAVKHQVHDFPEKLLTDLGLLSYRAQTIPGDSAASERTGWKSSKSEQQYKLSL